MNVKINQLCPNDPSSPTPGQGASIATEAQSRRSVQRMVRRPSTTKPLSVAIASLGKSAIAAVKSVSDLTKLVSRSWKDSGVSVK